VYELIPIPFTYVQTLPTYYYTYLFAQGSYLNVGPELTYPEAGKVLRSLVSMRPEWVWCRTPLQNAVSELPRQKRQ